MNACRFLIPRNLLAVALAVVPLALLPAAAQSAVIMVTSPFDSIGSGDGCSLREALINANTDSRAGSFECARGDGHDIIILQPIRYTLGRGDATDESDTATGDLDITSEVTIVGGGAQYTPISNEYRFRHFDVHAGGVLTLRGLSVEKGHAEDDGGAIRVAAGGTLNLVDVGVKTSRVSDLAVGGSGGGIYLAPGSQATLDRVEITNNTSLGFNGEGGGIHCDDCTLTLRAATVGSNSATLAGGGLLLSPLAQANVEFATFGFNTALDGAAIYSLGDLSFTAVVSADNGSGVAGSDLYCNGGSFSAAHSFAEYPAGCPPVGGPLALRTNADLPPDTPTEVLRRLHTQRFDGQPLALLYWNSAYAPYFRAQVPNAQCAGHVDQLGRRNVDGADCDIGGHFDWVVGANGMSIGDLRTGGTPETFYLGLIGNPVLPTELELVAIGGIGEACDLPSQTISLAAGQNSTIVSIDPDTLFLTPALNREQRICEAEIRVVSGDANLVGATTGILRFLLTDRTFSEQASRSSPAPGKYLDIGVVPVSTGGSKSIIFFPPVPGWSVTGVAIYGPDAPRFSTSASLPLALGTSAEGVTALTVQCAGGVLGEFDGVLEVTVVTDLAETLHLVYGLRCRVAHTLSFATSAFTVVEGDSVDLIVRLDSPSQLPGPYSVQLRNLGGSATVVDDYFAFALPETLTDPEVPTTVTFQPGEQEQVVSVAIVNDDLVEETEDFTAALVVPQTLEVAAVGALQHTVNIADNDFAAHNIQAQIDGMPTRAPPGQRVEVRMVVRNSSDTNVVDLSQQALRDVTVSLSVDRPVWIYSFANLNADCVVSPSKRTASCSFHEPLDADETYEITAYLEMADMTDAPQLDVRGVMRLKATGQVRIGQVVEDTAAVTYTVTGTGAGGGAVAPGLLLVALLLALRGQRKRVAGRRYGDAG